MDHFCKWVQNQESGYLTCTSVVPAPRNRELVLSINMLINMFMAMENPFIYLNPKRFNVKPGIDLFC